MMCDATEVWVLVVMMVVSSLIADWAQTYADLMKGGT